MAAKTTVKMKSTKHVMPVKKPHFRHDLGSTMMKMRKAPKDTASNTIEITAQPLALKSDLNDRNHDDRKNSGTASMRSLTNELATERL